MKVPTQSPTFTERGGSFRSSQYPLRVTGCGDEADTSTHVKCCNQRAGLGGLWGGGRGAVSTFKPRRLIQSDVFIFHNVSRRTCLQRTAGVRALYQSIAAALQFGLSGCRCSQLNLSGSWSELYIHCVFGTLWGGLRDSFTAFKRSIKKLCDRFIQRCKFQQFFM